VRALDVVVEVGGREDQAAAERLHQVRPTECESTMRSAVSPRGVTAAVTPVADMAPRRGEAGGISRSSARLPPSPGEPVRRGPSPPSSGPVDSSLFGGRREEARVPHEWHRDGDARRRASRRVAARLHGISRARHDLRPGRDASRASAECACSAVLRLVWDDPASQPSSAAVDVQARHEACHRH
jgi:hypothetical protein